MAAMQLPWVRLRYMLLCLKPVDWLALFFLLATFPLAALAGVWGGVALRIVLIPAVIMGRYYLNCDTTNESSLLTRVLVFALDFYPLVTCIYLYGEDGKTLAWMYPDREKSFWDDAFKHADSRLLGVPVEDGTGAYVRSRTSATFNRVLGEYLHFAYFAFYIILVGTPLLAWFVLPREYFDRVITAQTLVYMFCCGAYLVFPTAGPYWAYPDKRPEAEEVGFLFSKITHALVGGGSSIGTAFPSGHCSITVSAMVVSMIYIPRLFFLYLFIGPALVVATVWGGFHYFYDAMFGVLLGLVSAATGIAIARILPYVPPAVDHQYSAMFRARSGRDYMDLSGGVASPRIGRITALGGGSSAVFYMNLPEFDEEDEHKLGAKVGSSASLNSSLAFIPALVRSSSWGGRAAPDAA